MDWGPIIAAGVTLAQGMIQDENREQQLGQSRENLILNLQDNERGRQAADARQAAVNQSNELRTQIMANAQLQAANKRILGDVLLDQGKGQERLMLESFRAAANAPERYNDAASVLAQVLSR